jgi:branched-chain amino acid transport system substrate-binding protein
MKNRRMLLGRIFLLLSFLTLPSLVNSVKAAPADPIKVGLLVPQTGPTTQHGNEVKWGMTIALDEVGRKAAGRELKLIVEDDEDKPSVALQKARKLVESDRVDVLAGVVNSGVGLALREYVIEKKIPLIIAVASSDALTKEKASPYIFRTSYSSRLFESPMAPYAYKTMGLRKVIMVSPDYVAGRERAGWFKYFFEQLGGKVVAEVYHPLGTADFAPYLSKIKDADAVWSFEPGSDGIQFVKQYDEYGLKKKMPLIGSSASFQGYMLEAQKDAAVGAICAGPYTFASNTPENQKFIKAYQKMVGQRLPDIVAVGGYDAGRIIIEGLTYTKGDSKDVPRLLEGLKKAKIVSPRGPFAFDEKQNPICNIYIEKVVKKDGKYTREILYTYQNVSQDWTP